VAKHTDISGIVAGIGGGAVFVLFSPVLGLGVVPSLIAGAAAFSTILFISKGLQKKTAITPTHTWSTSEAIAISLDVANKLRIIQQDLAPGKARDYLDQLAKLSDLIAEDVRQDPKDAREALRFMGYYGETAVKIASLYGDLLKRGLRSQAIVETQTTVEKNLDILVKVFEMQLLKLQEDNLMDLDTEFKLLASTLELEGLGDKISSQK
jgi:hypothetical protein